MVAGNKKKKKLTESTFIFIWSLKIGSSLWEPENKKEFGRGTDSHCSVLSLFLWNFGYILLFWRPGTHYRIRPNCHTVRLGFSKLLGTLICGKICIYLLRIHYKKDQKKDLLDDDYVTMWLFLIFFIEAYVVGTRLNCIDKSKKFKWVPTTYAFRKK